MANAIRVTIPVEVEVDLDDYQLAYGLNETEDEVRGYVADIIAEAVQERLGPHTALDWGRYVPKEA